MSHLDTYHEADMDDDELENDGVASDDEELLLYLEKHDVTGWMPNVRHAKEQSDLKPALIRSAADRSSRAALTTVEPCIKEVRYRVAHQEYPQFLFNSLGKISNKRLQMF